MGEDEVAVAFARDRVEAEMMQGLLEGGGIRSVLRPAGMNVDGPQLGYGLLARGFGGGSQQVVVLAGQAERARALLAETLVEDREASLPEPVNAQYLEDAEGGRKPRGYGLVGAYARIYLWSFGLMAASFGIFLLVRAL